MEMGIAGRAFRPATAEKSSRNRRLADGIRLSIAIVLAALFLAGPIEATAQESTPSPAPTAAGTPASAADLAPAEATRAWLETVPSDQRARSDAYFEGKYWLLLWGFLVSVTISLLLLGSGASARIRDYAEKRTRFKFLQVVIYAVPFVLLTSLLAFPLSVYENFYREHAYEMATHTFGAWFKEQMIGLALDIVAASLFLPVLYAVFRHARRTWWLWASGAATLFVLILMMIAPVYIAPLFNKYKPIEDATIRDPILAMAKANEIPVKQVFEVDASKQTKRISANVSGFLGTTRIALNDNLLKQCTLPEIHLVMAHEMGHYILGHGAKLVIAFGLMMLFTFGVARATFDGAVKRWGQRWGVRDIADPAGLPLLTLIFVLVFFVLTPVDNSITRIIEREADAFAINAAREPDGFAKVALKLGAYRKMDPGPIEEIIFYDHPSGRARIRMAMDWKAAKLPAGQIR